MWCFFMSLDAHIQVNNSENILRIVHWPSPVTYYDLLRVSFCLVLAYALPGCKVDVMIILFILGVLLIHGL